MAFMEVQFPTGIGYHRLGSPSGFFTTVNSAFSGQEQRNQNWSTSRGKWTVSLTTPSDAERAALSRAAWVEILIAFHLNAAGKANAFRLKDHLDYQFSAQQIGIGSGTFQLTKSYTIGGLSYIRKITKPVWSTVNDYQGNALAQSVSLFFNAAPTTYGTDWTIDATTGLVTVLTAAGGVLVTATGQFHYPVRFDVDQLPLRVMESDVAGGNPIVTIDSCPLLEVPPPSY